MLWSVVGPIFSAGSELVNTTFSPGRGITPKMLSVAVAVEVDTPSAGTELGLTLSEMKTLPSPTCGTARCPTPSLGWTEVGGVCWGRLDAEDPGVVTVVGAGTVVLEVGAVVLEVGAVVLEVGAVVLDPGGVVVDIGTVVVDGAPVVVVERATVVADAA